MEGRQEGQVIGEIHAYEKLLNRSKTPEEQLLKLSIDQLNRMANELRGEVTKK
jgi:hypothetical protein